MAVALNQQVGTAAKWEQQQKKGAKSHQCYTNASEISALQMFSCAYKHVLICTHEYMCICISVYVILGGVGQTWSERDWPAGARAACPGGQPGPAAPPAPGAGPQAAVAAGKDGAEVWERQCSHPSTQFSRRAWENRRCDRPRIEGEVFVRNLFAAFEIFLAHRAF